MGEYNRLVFGENLKYLRNKYNMNQETLAKKVGVSQNTISSWENGIREPDSIEIFLKICDIFGGISLDRLLNNSLECSENQKFLSAQEAFEYIIKQPTVAMFGGYDLEKMSDEEIIEFANDLADMIAIVSKKYKK